MLGTTRVAEMFGVRPQSIHVAILRTGSFRGVVPVKPKKSGQALKWPENEIRALLEDDARCCGVERKEAEAPTQNQRAALALSNLSAGQTIGSRLTMSSREIAELTGKQHRNVMRDIRAMLTELDGEGGRLSFEQSYTNDQGKKQPCFNLPKRESLILVSGYNVQMRAKIIDRWQELEAQQGPTADPRIPKSFSEALLLAAQTQQEKEAAISEKDAALRKAETLSVKITEDSPKVAFFNKVAAVEDDEMSLNEAAKLLGTGERRLIALLRSKGYFMKKAPLPYQDVIDRGLFRVTERVAIIGQQRAAHPYRVCVVTQKGLYTLQSEFYPNDPKQMSLLPKKKLPLRWPSNPFPSGMQAGSVTDKVLDLLTRDSGVMFTCGQIQAELNVSRGGVAWAVRYLQQHGFVVAVEGKDERNSQYLMYRARTADDVLFAE